jgi:hypothetical protein
VILYKEGQINKEGFERVCEDIKVLKEVFQTQDEPPEGKVPMLSAKLPTSKDCLVAPRGHGGGM